MSEHSLKRRRSGGRTGNMRRRASLAIDQMPWRLPINLDRPTEPLDSDAIAAIHEGAMIILEDIGIEFLNQAALDLFKKAGCKVRDQNVRMGREFVMEMIAKAPQLVHDNGWK